MLRSAHLPSPLATVAVVALWLAGPGPASAQTAAPNEGVACTLILDAASAQALLRQGTCEQRFSPASTFKVPLAVAGYDAGILTDEHTPAWDYKAAFNAPRRDHKTVDPTIWEKDSFLWFSREVVRRLGRKRFAAYVSKLTYGNRDVSGDLGRDNGLTHAWLASSLRISPEEQAGFMRRLLLGSLPVSASAQAMTRAVMPTFQAGDGWTVKGKTGSIWLRTADGEIDRTRPLGWFVGWAEGHGRRIVFARLVVDTRRSATPKGPSVRDAFLKDLPGLMAKAGHGPAN